MIAAVTTNTPKRGAVILFNLPSEMIIGSILYTRKVPLDLENCQNQTITLKTLPQQSMRVIEI
jgi:hypothetical protein